jgi:hypothetical protein
VTRIIGETSVYTSLAAYLGDEERHAREMYRLLDAYYEANGLYDRLHLALTHVNGDTEALRPLRNPANRAVEFYAAKLWPEMTLHAENEAIVAPIEQVWTWSNWTARKQVAARWFALHGDLFLKVVRSADRARGDSGRVYFQLIRAEYVTDFDVDERGYLVYIRLDVPITRRQTGDGRERDAERRLTWTEVWDKAGDSYRVWEHDQPEDTPLERLGTPKEALAMTADLAIDFLPFVWAPFRDIGQQRGVGCFTHCLDKIDEANRVATRLHQMQFRHAGGVWALEADLVDALGRPIPPPTIGKDAKGDDGAVVLGQERLVKLPGGWHLKPLVPQIQYEAALKILEAHMQELEWDLPELAYYRLRESSELSGRAIRLLLTDLVDKATEARGNAVAALVRANQMALTIGARAGIPAFAGVGEYEAGALDHEIELPDVIPLSEIERLEALGLKRDVLALPTVRLQKEAGYTDEEIADIATEREAERAAQQETLAAAMVRAQRQLDRGDADPEGA